MYTGHYTGRPGKLPYYTVFGTIRTPNDILYKLPTGEIVAYPPGKSQELVDQKIAALVAEIKKEKAKQRKVKGEEKNGEA